MSEIGTNSKADRIFVFQGGGALGAYQAGAYEALYAHDVDPDWLAGISIGSINSAIIAGSPREKRVENLRAFWDMVSSNLNFDFAPDDIPIRRATNNMSATMGAMFGIPGFFSPRLQTPFQWLHNPASHISFYDTDPLMKSLENIIDFNLLNNGPMRLSLGAVEVTTGNFAYFDSRDTKIDVRHIAASGALPPGFPPVEIDGRFYWDGGLVSNTPLQHVLRNNDSERDLDIFQVDLFSARGEMPKDQFEVESRTKEIRYSSRTRMNTDDFAQKQMAQRAAKRLLDKLPPEFQDDDDAKFLRTIGHEYDVTIVHLIHRRAAYATHSMDAEFSRISVNEHWQAGYDDVSYTLKHPKWRNRSRPKNGIQVFDLARERKLHVQA